MIGMATVDYLYVLDDYPPPDSVTRALDYMTVVGGVAGRAAIAARRLGGAARLLASCGADVHARFLREQLDAEGVDCTWVTYDQPSQHSAVIAARGDATRTIIWLPQPMADARMLSHLPEVLDGVDVALLDATDEALARAALDECERRGVVTVLDTGSGRPWTRELLDRSRHVIAPEKYVRKETGLAAAEAIAELWRDDVHAVFAVTQGPSGGVYVTRDDPQRLRRWDAAPSDAVDSNGAGDTFHGAYTWALARGRAPAECLGLAAWAAALKASQPGNAGIPTLEKLERARASGRARRPE
jgi:sugar/nucleoside kinase (ribokinase family)